MQASITASELKSALAGAAPPLVIDVRRRPAFSAAQDMIAGAFWRDPEQVAAWAPHIPKAGGVVVYCVHGHEVSQNVAKTLNQAGIAAQYLEGGIEEGWKSAGGAVQPRKYE
jgi:rhodanese-related sulfurtransferase